MNISEIQEFALRAHGDQRYGDHPYRVHLEHVVEVLQRFGYAAADPLDPLLLSHRLVAAAWLHDVLEDTPTTYAELERVVGPEITALVDAVTKAPGSRQDSLLASWAKICAHPDAVTLKLADRIANVEASRRSSPRLLAMYQREWEGFHATLRRAGGDPAMWAHLGHLLAAAR